MSDPADLINQAVETLLTPESSQGIDGHTAMRGLDTNILIRHITQDDPTLSPKATRLIEHQLTENDPGFISPVTLAETVWVLASLYSLKDDQVASTVERILQIEVFVVQNAPQALLAMQAMESGKASLPDALIAALGTWSGCTSTLTFDKKAARLPGFTLL